MSITKKISSSSLAENFHKKCKITVYHPTDHSIKLKHRKVIKKIEDFPALKTVCALMKNNFDVVSFSDTSKTDTEEDLLVSVTHRVLSIRTLHDNKTHDVLVPITKASTVKVFSLDRTLSRDQNYYKCLYDYNSILFVSMVIASKKSELTNGSAGKDDDESDYVLFDVEFRFEIIYINTYNFIVKRFCDVISLKKRGKQLEFTLTLKDTLLAIVWADEAFIHSFDMSQTDSRFLQNSLIKGVSDEFKLAWKRDYLAITENDHDFMDNVFSAKDVSKRRTVFYKVDRGALLGHEFLCSHKMLTRIYEKEHLDYPSDIIFVDIPENPLWVVKEWNLPDITLKKLLFYYEKQDVLKTLEFSTDCENYENYFQTPDEYQMSGFEICNLTWQLFLWCSKQHILVINLKTHSIDFILELTTKQYFDFKNEFHEYKIDLSRFGNNIRVIITKNKEYVHYERFQLPILYSLKELAKMVLVKNYTKSLIEKCLLDPHLKDEILMIY